MYDILPLKISFLCHIVILHKERGISWGERGLDLCWRPHKELPFFTLSISILRRVETPFGRGHLAYNIIQRLFDNATIECVPRHKVAMQIDAAEQCVIVQHLLEVRYQPLRVN